MNEKKLSTENYKGVRDFYPNDYAIQDYIFTVWKNVCKKYGYQQYDASILEPSELYEAKTGEEIINNQTYSFTDRGERKITLRPEMTPTVARMIAGKRRDIGFPARWFSIPNLFRYETPQRGRLREHWQLNVDIFGIDNLQAEAELIEMAKEILVQFNFKQENFEIRINDRNLVETWMNGYELDDKQKHSLSKLIDKKEKLNREEFENELKQITDKKIEFDFKENDQIIKLKEILKQKGVDSVVFDPYLMRGFDYYTGIVFEIFDKSPENNRSVFGGGRYDRLTELFDNEKIPAVGFGMGDVVIANMFETYGIEIPKTNCPDIYIAILDEKAIGKADEVALELRKEFSVAVDYSLRKIDLQVKHAKKTGATKLIVIGEDEVNGKGYTVQTLL